VPWARGAERFLAAAGSPQNSAVASPSCTVPAVSRAGLAAGQGRHARWPGSCRGQAEGNDFYLFDGKLAVFLLYTGAGLAAGMMATTDPGVLGLCREAFKAVWELSVPHRDYAAV
jgi:hypothetical protein